MAKLLLMGALFVVAAPVLALGFIGYNITSAAIKAWETFKGVG